jgi:hypothetical protein
MIDRARKLAILTRWKKAIEEADAHFDPVVEMLRLDPENPLCEAVWRTQSALTTTTSDLLDDGFEWLGWFWLENDMGRKGLEAGTKEAKRPIRTLDDLVWLLEVVA